MRLRDLDDRVEVADLVGEGQRPQGAVLLGREGPEEVVHNLKKAESGSALPEE